MAETKEGQLSLDGVIRLLETPELIKEGFIENLYDQWTPSYDQQLTAKNYVGPVIASFKMCELYSDKGISILDCGAGTGLVGQALKEREFTNVTAVDISQKSLDLSAKKGCYSRLVLSECGDKNMPFKDDSYDALLGISCFAPGHVEPVALRDWARIVKPGGFIIATIREAYFGEEYGANFTKVVGEFIKEGLLRQEGKTLIPNMWDQSNAFIHTWKVL